MRILHLTDFHFQSGNKHQYEQNNLVNALVSKLEKETQIDYLIFSGDLVQSGAKLTDFEKAKELLIDKIISETQISIDKIFICGGNHDVYQGQELMPITEALNKIKSNEELESFIKDQGGKSFKLSIEGLRNYINFEKGFYNKHGEANKDILSDLFNIHYRNENGKRIGIASFNSGWRALNSKTDRGNLLFPISFIKNAINELKSNSDFRIALIHHPISDFKDWNASEIENLIHSEFHLLFSGHVHQKKQSLHICSDEGILCCFSPATLAMDSWSNIGFTIVEVDLDSYEVKIESRKYDKTEKVFYDLPEISEVSIPVNTAKREQNSFRKTLRKRYIEVLKRANELFVSSDDNEGKGFIDLFTDPVLKNNTKAQISEKKSDSGKVLLESIFLPDENYVIYGKDKGGKTSILFKIQLELLSNFAIYKALPIYIDCKEYKLSSANFNIQNYISTFYELNKNNSNKLPEKFNIRLLLDNYDPNFDSLNEVINNLLDTYPKISFVATTEETLLTSFDIYHFDGRSYKNIFIQEISRTEVRSLANKWPNLTTEKRELILEKIFKVQSQLNIPANYWTVSLFIWVFEKNQEANVRNNFELIQYYVDDLLDKDKIIHDKGLKIEFEDFKEYLAQLAHYLVINHHNTGYTSTYTELVNFTQEYIDANKRFVISVEEIIQILLSKGVIRKNGVNRYTIRLTGVFEYFIAFFMKDNPDFRDEVIKDDHYYLSFSNELELCAGFNRKDKGYVVRIFEKTKEIFSDLIDLYSSVSIDRTLELVVSGTLDNPIQKLAQDINGASPIEMQDDAFTEMQSSENKQTEVVQKKFYETIEKTGANLEKSLFILSRVFRNSALMDDKLDEEILNFILQASCIMGFKLVEEVKTEVSYDGDETKEKLMLLLMSTFMPLMVQTFVYDALAQNNLERIILSKIKELKPTAKTDNQFKLLILYFMLIDLNLKSNKKHISEAMDVIKVGVLKQTILIKLYGYLMFDSRQNSPLEEFLKTKIQEQSINISSKTDKAKVQQKVAKIINTKKIKK
jgi:predicted MPP superfamily phosphohydrolase